MSPKVHEVYIWLPTWHYWEVVEMLQVGCSGMSLHHCGCALDGDSGTLVSFSLLLPSHEVKGFSSSALLS